MNVYILLLAVPAALLLPSLLLLLLLRLAGTCVWAARYWLWLRLGLAWPGLAWLISGASELAR